jgi:hypothetical protein
MRLRHVFRGFTRTAEIVSRNCGHKNLTSLTLLMYCCSPHEVVKAFQQKCLASELCNGTVLHFGRTDVLHIGR